MDHLSEQYEHGAQSNAGKMAELAYTDSLTGLFNRRYLEERLTRLVKERDEDPAPFAFGILDLDGFKPINDLFGHAAGDDILFQIGQRLKSCLPKTSIAARLGGDEFAVLLPLVFNNRQAAVVGEAIRDVISAPYDLDGRTVQVSSCIGLTLYPYGGRNSTEILNSADSALYRSKKQGRAAITIYTDEIAKEMKRLTEIEQALRRAIKLNQVRPYYQPVVEVETGSLKGFEALARWTDSALGAITPDMFIQLAEDRGFIGTLSKSLLAQAAKFAANWSDDLFLSFNLSSAELIDPTTALDVISIINRAGLNPRRLELEITETAIIADPDLAKENINNLRMAGIRVALDDFGTGQSSLARLREFKFDKLKIDRSFISNILDDPTTEHIVRAIVEMCRAMDISVVAEGIEYKGQAEILANLGCQLGQGYYYGKAMHPDEIVQKSRLLNAASA